MPRVIEALQNFDRKERIAILRKSLGLKSDKTPLSDDFRKKLSLCLDITVPKCVFLTTDYHLDWLHMALYLKEKSEIPDKYRVCNQHFKKVNQNSQDIDLLIAFEEPKMLGTETHLVLIEAKAYLSNWTNKQLGQKAVRLCEIFGSDGKTWANTSPHFVLMTRKISQGICAQSWPTWMKGEDIPIWLEYDLPRRRKITRCDENGNNAEHGGYLRIDSTEVRDAPLAALPDDGDGPCPR